MNQRFKKWVPSPKNKNFGPSETPKPESGKLMMIPDAIIPPKSVFTKSKLPKVDERALKFNYMLMPNPYCKKRVFMNDTVQVKSYLQGRLKAFDKIKNREAEKEFKKKKRNLEMGKSMRSISTIQRRVRPISNLDASAKMDRSYSNQKWRNTESMMGITPTNDSSRTPGIIQRTRSKSGLAVPK